MSLELNPLSSSFYDTTLRLFALDGYVLLGSDHIFTLQSFKRGVCLGCDGWWRAVQSYIFGTNIFFPQVFSTFLSLKANLILYAKWNEFWT